MKRQANPRLSSAGDYALAQYEHTLVAAVTKAGTLRDRALIDLLLHTGLRSREICQRPCDQAKLGKRSSFLEVLGKRNKYREVPLNATGRNVLKEYLPTLPSDIVFLFRSGKTGTALSERALGYTIKKYAQSAMLPDVSSHDLRHCFGYRMAETVPLHRLAKSCGITHRIQPNCTFKERSRICNRLLRPSRGHNVGD